MKRFLNRDFTSKQTNVRILFVIYYSTIIPYRGVKCCLYCGNFMRSPQIHYFMKKNKGKEQSFPFKQKGAYALNCMLFFYHSVNLL